MAEKPSAPSRSEPGDDLQAARALFPDLVEEAKTRAMPQKRARNRPVPDAIREPAPVFRVARAHHD